MEMNEEMNEKYVDWKGHAAEPTKHDGKKAASFVCVTETLENMVFISNASNLITYFRSYMHYPVAKSANMVTNFMGTSFILTLFGGFVSDSFITRFSTIIIFGFIQFIGLVILAVQARSPYLRPLTGKTPSLSQEAMLYVGLYAVSMGVGGVKASLPAHGADQFDSSNKRLVSRYFNWFFFFLCVGGLLAVTVLVWVEENKGWQWGFTICVIAFLLALCIFGSGLPFYRHKVPTGSPFTRIFKVFVSTIQNRETSVHPIVNPEQLDKKSDARFRFLDKATSDGSITVAQVRETKSFLSLLPIFACTVMMNCCLAQLQTFSVQQGVSMDTSLTKNFHIPPASLTTMPLLIMLVSVPLYDHISSLLAKKSSTRISSIGPLRRIGVGLLLASASMAVAAVVEVKRRNAMHEGTKLTVFWLGWQYVLLGVSDMFTLAGMLEFFYSEAPYSMRSLCTSLSWCSTSMGYFLSSVLVDIVNSVSSRFGSSEWLGGNDLNKNRLDLFYALLAVLNFINFFHYLFWARWY